MGLKERITWLRENGEMGFADARRIAIGEEIHRQAQDANTLADLRTVLCRVIHHTFDLERADAIPLRGPNARDEISVQKKQQAA